MGLGLEEGLDMVDLQPKHQEPTSFIWKYVFSTDHKVIAKQFLWTGLIINFALWAGRIPHDKRQRVRAFLQEGAINRQHVAQDVELPSGQGLRPARHGLLLR